LNRLDQIIIDVARALAGPEWRDRLKVWLHHGLSKVARKMIVERYRA
jgi:hypothetical protein